MESKIQEEQQSNEIITEPGLIEKLSPKTPSSDQPWQEWIEPVWETLAKVPDYIGEFFSDNKQPLVTIGLIVAGLITVKFTLAILDAINDIPLLAPILELVGLGYTGWFVYRYLWKASSRQELVTEFDALKSQIVGDGSQNG
jgi:hypothetical protein